MSGSLKKVSMIMPCYNSAPYLDGSLQSVIDQDYGDIELIAVYDESEDDTMDILKRWRHVFAKRGFEMKIVTRNEKKGIAAALNSGLACSSGEYICFPDSDDYLYPNYASAMVDCLERNPEYGWAKCIAEWTREEEPERIVMYSLNPPESLKVGSFEQALSNRFVIAVWVVMVRRQYICSCIPSMRFYEGTATQEWQLDLPLSFAGRYKSVDKILYRYIKRPGSQSIRDSIPEKLDNYLKMHEQIYRVTCDTLPLSKEQVVIADHSATLVFLRMRYNKYAQNKWFDKLGEVAHSLKPLACKILPDLACLDDGKWLSHCVPLLEYCLDAVLRWEARPRRECLEKFLRALSSAKEYLVYGAGEGAAQIVLAMKDTFGPPVCVWDRAAHEGSAYFGIRLAKPQFDAIPPEQKSSIPVVVAIRNEYIAAEAVASLSQNGYGTFFSFEEMMNALQASLEL
jgi:glycosyltransferase involved in cell wall biosynthesis